MTTDDRDRGSTDDALIRYLGGETHVELSTEDRAEIDALNALLADPTLWAEPPADLEDRIVASIVAEAALTAPPPVSEGTVPKGAVDLAAARTRRADRESRAAQERSRWRRPGFLVTSAAAVAAVALGTVLLIRVLIPQPSFDAALSGTDLSPGASGSVTMTRTDSGWDIHLEATGLPRLDNGQYYQAWLKNAAGVLVPIGSFNEPADAAGRHRS